jgi:hypothetical protein
MRKPSQLVLALQAGFIAIALNSVALALGDNVGVTTAHGGLLRLLVVASLGTIHPPSGPAFGFAFHTLVGLLMAIVYAFGIERRLPGAPWVKGFLYAAAVYAANAFVVLPILDEGIAGSNNLTAIGIAWFAAAHTLFFVVLAVVYARLAAAKKPRRIPRTL